MNQPRKRARVVSLGAKTTLGILAIALILSAIGIVVSYQNYASTMDEHYKTLALNLARTAAASLDADALPGYLDTLKTDDAYNRTFSRLLSLKENNDVEYLYVERLLKREGEYGAVYIFDTDLSADAAVLGDWFPAAPSFAPQAQMLIEGGTSEPTISNTPPYGWLVTTLYPVYNSDGECVAHVGVDISMDEVMDDREDFLLTLCFGMGIAAVLFGLLFLFFTRMSIVAPINRLAYAANAFISEKSEQEGGISQIKLLDIHTGDEIENLAAAIQQMERDINTYIENLTAVTAEKERIGAELGVAKQIQASMLPCIFPPYPERPEFDIFASMEPAKEVGGDFYDFYLVDEDHIAVVIADVSGKGVPAALFMVIAKTLIKNHALQKSNPADVFTAVNAQLCENNEAGMFVTAFMGILNVRTGRFTYANAGHNLPLLRHADGGFDWLRSRPGFVLAGMEGIRYRLGELTMQPGDCLFLYTDGVTEALNPALDLYSDPRLQDTLNRPAVLAQPIDALLHTVRQDIDVFADGAEQADDITMLALQFKRRTDD